MNSPETKYAKSGEYNIAYQVFGATSPDLLLVPGWVSNVEYAWEDPYYATFLRKLGAFSRVIVLDRRGTGMSDPVMRLPTMEDRIEDVRAVLDAVGSTRTILVGISEGGPMAILFAATYPDRATKLILYGTFAYRRHDAETPWGLSDEEVNGALTMIESNWGKGITARLFAPSLAENESFLASWGRFERRSVSPGSARKLLQMALDGDVRPVLPSIHVPTLIIHRAGDLATPVEGARAIAAKIPDARYIELEGVDHFPWVGDVDALLDPIREFVTGAPAPAQTDRVLATVLFVDIVDSTGKAARIGDRRWRLLLEQFNSARDQEFGRFGGILVSDTGDGFMARFDGPARAIRCARGLSERARTLELQIRAGVHTGECEVADSQMRGIAVHIAARIMAEAPPGAVYASQTVKDLVAGSGIAFADAGTRALKGVPDEWRLHVVTDA